MTVFVRWMLLLLVFGQAGACLSAEVAAGSAKPGLTALAVEPLWLDLLHVNQGGLWHGRGRSTTQDPDFFLAAAGARNPLAEMQAEITAFTAIGDTTRCRFPARYKFLARKLGWYEPAPFGRCTQYLQWRKGMPDQQIVVVLPVGTMADTASMFGHLFLRLDAVGSGDNVLMSRTVGFLTELDADDNAVVRNFKGLSGGYSGHFFFNYFVGQLNQYIDIHSRDVWEYRLNLSPVEISRLLDHIWALRGIDFRYFFLDDNCSYQLLSLLQVARPETPLLEELAFAAIPVNAVRKLKAKGFVVDRGYRPSIKSKLYWQAQHLPAAQQELAKRLAFAPAVAKQDAFASLDRQQRFRIANLALTYFDFATRDTKHEQEQSEAQQTLHDTRYALLRVIHANTPANLLPPAPSPTPPDAGHDTHLWSLAAGQRDGAPFVDLQLRFAYHDLLDHAGGFVKGMGVTGLELTLRAYVDDVDQQSSEEIELQSLRLVSVRNLAPRDLYAQPVSWFADMGMEQVRIGGKDHLAGYVEGGPGLAWRRGAFMPYAFLKGRLEYNSVYDGFDGVGAGAQLGVLYYKGRLSARLGFDTVYFANEDWRLRASLGANWALSRNNALRLSLSHGWYDDDEVSEWSLAWRHYF